MFRAQSTPVPPYTTGGDSAKPDIADKAVTVGEGASPGARRNFLHVIIFENCEYTNVFAEARLLSRFHASWVSASTWLKSGLPLLEALGSFM